MPRIESDAYGDFFLVDGDEFDPDIDLGDEDDHEPWCSDTCDGFMEMDGGFVTVSCQCPCHYEGERL